MQNPDSEEIDRSNTDDFWTKDHLVAEITKIQMALQEKASIRLKEKNPNLLYKDLQRRFDVFYKRYPTLFNMIVTQGNELDQVRLANLLNMYEKVRINQIKEYDASVKIGSDLYGHYVKPFINEDEKK